MLYSFEDFALDRERRELRAAGAIVAVEPQVFDVLVFLIENRDRVVSKDDLIAAVWQGRIVSESTLSSRINAARKAIGDSGKQQRLIRTMARKGMRFVGEVNQKASDDASTIARKLPSDLQQQIRFCTASDGVRIAYAEVGRGPPLLRTGHWLTHLEYDWQSPIWRPFLEQLALEYRVIRYDARGNGLSDWNVEDISLEAFVRDVESVVAASGLDRFPLFGVSQGCAISVAYAIRHPERVTHLVLYGGFARGILRSGSSKAIAQMEALSTLMLNGWGNKNPAFRQIFTNHFLPDGRPEQFEWFNDLQRVTTSPENAVRIFRTVEEFDVSGLLSKVRVPTLVLHCRDDMVAPFELGRRLAAGIPGARFVALEGRNHLILEGDPGHKRFLDEINDFLKS